MQGVTLALAREPIRRMLLWSAPRQQPTVMLMGDGRAAYKRAFAASLLAARHGHGSQRRMAKIAETSEATYRRWENPDEPGLPDAWQLAQIAKACDADPEQLVFPEALSVREWELTKRAARATARALTQSLGDGGEPA